MALAPNLVSGDFSGEGKQAGSLGVFCWVMFFKKCIYTSL